MREWRKKVAEERVEEAASSTVDNASPSIDALLKMKLQGRTQPGDGEDSDDLSTDDERGNVTDEEKDARKAKKKEDRQNFQAEHPSGESEQHDAGHHERRCKGTSTRQAPGKQAKLAKEKENKAKTQQREEALLNEAARKAPAILECIDNIGGVGKLDEKTLSKGDMQVIIRFKTGKAPTANNPKLLDIIRTLCKD